MKKYQKPDALLTTTFIKYDLLDGASLPYGGEDGPGIAESKERDELYEETQNEETQNEWGNLW